MWHPYDRILPDSEKEWRTGACHNKDELWKADDKWEKPVTKDLICYDSIHVNVQNRQIYKDRKLVVAWDWRRWRNLWWQLAGGVDNRSVGFLSGVMEMF